MLGVADYLRYWIKQIDVGCHWLFNVLEGISRLMLGVTVI